MLENRRLVSSLCIIDFVKALSKFLIYKRNNKGSSVDLCGTLHRTFFMSEEYVLISTYIVLNL